MNEADGTALLHARFTEAGYTIVQNCRFTEGDIDVELDGWDAEKRIGYEYITAEAHDELQFTPATLERFEARMHAGELYVLLIDEHHAVTADSLDAAARGILAEVVKVRAQAKTDGPK